MEGEFPRENYRNYSKEYREDHLGHIYLLLDTLSQMAQEALERLTVLAATRKPAVVREVLVQLLAEGISAHLVGERMWSAPEFFNALLKEADRGSRTLNYDQTAFERLMQWFDPVDPLRISQKAEYKKSVPPKVWV